MTLTPEPDLDMLKVNHNQHAQHQRKRSFISKVIAQTDRQTDRHTHMLDWLL